MGTRSANVSHTASMKTIEQVRNTTFAEHLTAYRKAFLRITVQFVALISFQT